MKGICNMTLDIRKLSFQYENKQQVLQDITFTLEQGELLGILGTNGTGKTTLLKCLNYLLKPRSGEVLYDGISISCMHRRQVAKIIAYVPQYNGSVFDSTVIDTILTGRVPYSPFRFTEEDKRIAFQVLRKMKLESFAFRHIQQMSGGERQRVFIARALAQRPQVLLLDEPTSSLDPYNQLFILQIVQQIVKENGLSSVLTIHDLNLAAMFCDKLLLLDRGRVFAYGSPQEVLTAQNINKIYKVNAVVTRENGCYHVRLLKNI